MTQKHQIKAEIVRKEKLTKDVVRLTLNAPEIAAHASPGQFLMVKATDKLEPILRRPFSIHQATANGRVQILFKVVGRGSHFLSERENGDVLEVIGPLGHGFTLSENENICIVGGGMGIAPLYFLTKRILRERPGGTGLKIFLGAATAGELASLKDDFENLGIIVSAATDDGSLGYHGYVTDLVAQNLEKGRRWQFYCCGPYPMMGKIVGFCEKGNWPCQVSLETLMACGISACLGCTVRSSQAKSMNGRKPYMHVCKDGPVFDSGDLAWNREDR